MNNYGILFNQRKFLSDPIGKKMVMDYEHDDGEMIEICIESRGYEDVFDIRFDVEIVAPQVEGDDLLKRCDTELKAYFS